MAGLDTGSDPGVERTVVEAPDASPSSAAFDRELEPGPEIGRYLVIDEIGAGGMGRVYRAYDPKLGREVALKRLRISSGDRSSGARMLREAKAMALLSHPNVVPIYDVDVDGGTLFIAMEYVRGATLDAWLAADTPDWRGVLAMFVQAGQGLAAAHAQGLVHRDFKPSNVVVGEDRRPRVMDFGLARAVGDAFDEPLPAALSFPLGVDDGTGGPELGGDLGMTLTADGTVVGTPRYMAPEQHFGEPVDARTDQYAFCVALWEALFRRVAFMGRSVSDLAAAKLLGPPRPPNAKGIPAVLHAILARGMARVPSDRWPDMPTLLAAIDRAGARRRWWLAAVLPAVAVPVGIVWALRPAPCSSSDHELDGVWDADARARVEAALRASAVSFAESTIARVDAVLDERAAAWTSMHDAACVATMVRHEQSDEALDLRMDCLDARRRQMQAVVDLLADADAGVTEHAIDLVAGLTTLDRCADVAALRERVPPPELASVREAVADVRARLEQARLEYRAGRVEDALATAESAHADATATRYEPAMIEAETEVASILTTLGRAEQARPMLEHAFERALVHRDLHASATAALRLQTALERLGARKDEVQWLIRAALGMAEGDGNDPQLVSNALLAYAGIYADRDLELEAETYVAAAVTRLEEALGPEHPDLIEPLSTQALFARALHRTEESTALQKRALELAERTFGPDHPQITDPLKLIGFDALMDGRGADALAAFDRIVAIQDATLGPEHPSTIASQGLRALALAELDRFAEAVAVADATITNMDRSMPELHSSRALTLHNLGRVFQMAGDHPRAVVTLREVVRIRRDAGHQSTLAAGITALGSALADNGELDEAERVLLESVELEAKVHADDGVHDTGAVARLADVLRRKGELVRARELLETALARVGDDDSSQHIDARWQLGRILWELDEDRPRAVELVAQAHDRLARLSGRMAAEGADEMRTWLDAHVVPVAEDPLAR